MQEQNTEINQAHAKSQYSLMYKLGALAAFAAALLYLFQLLFTRWSIYPETVKEWYELFARSRVLGLFYLNALDIIAFGLSGITFVGLCKSLQNDNKSLTAIALPFAFLGIGVFIVPRTLLLSFVQLSNEYASAASAAEAGVLIAAGKAAASFAVPTIESTGFFIAAFSAFLLSIAMLESLNMPKIAGFIGVMAFFLTIAENICVYVMPGLAHPMLVVTGAFWVAWWVLVGVGLARVKSE